MKKFTSLLIGCSLALVGVALAQQPEPEQSPKGKKQQGVEKTEKAEPKNQPKTRAETRGENVVKPEATTGVKQHGAKNERSALKTEKAEMTPKPEARTSTENHTSAETGVNTTTGTKFQPGEERRNGVKERAESEKTSATSTTGESVRSGQSFSTTNQANRQVNAGARKKPEREQVEQIRAQHTNFHAQPKPQLAPAVTFNQSYRIQGSQRWQGPQYEVFRSYHPERHDQGWYRSHYNRVELIGGGYYYWNNGYWYPAWGYDPSAQYYAYDGPIYVGHNAEPPDQVIADVQSELQQMGYYQGEVDGLLGPITQQALTAYQADQGLEPTAAIDEPTLDSLGMGT